MTDGWQPIDETTPIDVPVLIAVGWDGQRYTRVGTLNISSAGNEFGARYWWVFGPQGGERATPTYIGEPTHWQPLPAPPPPVSK